MMESYEVKAFENLRIAVVKCAVNDYRIALRRLKKNANDYRAEDGIKALKRWFRSDDYKIYCKIDGEYMIRMIERDFEKKWKKKEQIKKKKKVK